MSISDNNWFSNIKRPSRYLGNEINSVKKDLSKIEVSIALAFPDVYEIGMSHVGLKILYQILNDLDWVAAERAFSPWVDLENELRHRGLPLTSLESEIGLSNFDIVGFSIQHEICLTNVLTMLELGGIALDAIDRKNDTPLVIAGGPACFNPEPFSRFFDLIVIGDGEEVSRKICEAVREHKKRRNAKKNDLLRELSRIRGIYVPSFFNVSYKNDGVVESIDPVYPDYTHVEKSILSDIDTYPFPERQIVPFAELIHDRMSIEIARGCTRGCRFCQAGMIYRPVRERNPAGIIRTTQSAIDNTGHDEISLLSLSSGDYSSIEPLVKALMDMNADKKVAVSLPSLRIDSMSPGWIEQIKRVRKTGFTLAPEAGNDRMRRIINKGLTDREIIETAQLVYGAGWNLIKLYFMIGLPFEEDTDLLDIARLAKRIVSLSGGKGKKPKLNVSISPFVPKSHTPFMWMPQISLTESRRKLKLIQDALRGSKIKVKWNQPEINWLEGIFSRGDRRLGTLILEAWKRGARFDAWGDQFNIDIWKDALAHTGIDPSFYLERERPFHETLPWDHTRSGVTKEFFINEMKRAVKEKFTPDCREKCLNCGVCDHKTIDPVLFKGNPEGIDSPVSTAQRNIPSRFLRLHFTKLEKAGYLSHLELMRTFTRAFRRAGLDLAYSKGFHPMPRLSFACALPVGLKSEEETVDIEVFDLSDLNSLKDRINNQLPSGISVTDIEAIPQQRRKERLKESHYQIRFEGIKIDQEAVDRFLKSEHFTVVKVDKKGQHSVDVRPLVKSIRPDSGGRLHLEMLNLEGPGIKVSELIKGLFSLAPEHIERMKIVKIKQLLE